ncbi:hypothetical protein TcWFU_008798 [Taenia crassiceps]|uniref:Secreted protein n=1 Tax=Taenia crassiceps TaxID=6207 RepID=A0ABR4QTA7_9CEST
MHLLVVFLCLLAEGHRSTSSSSANGATDLVETLFDYLLSLVRLTLPEPMSMNTSPKGLINVENAKIYGLSSATRSCPVDLKVGSTSTADYFNGTLCIDLKDFFKVDAIFQINTIFYDFGPNPATLQLFDFKVNLDFTVTLPKIYHENSRALLKLDGAPIVEISRLEFIPPPDADGDDAFNFFTDLTGIISAGPIGGYIEMRIAQAIRMALEQVNKSVQKNVANLAKLGG